MCKCVLDDQPLGRGLGRFLYEYLANTQERVFRDASSALSALADYDPDLAACWARLLSKPVAGLTLDLFDDGAPIDVEIAPNQEAFGSAVLAGCRRRLLTCREPSLRALRSGFVEYVDLQIQLAALSSAELLRMLRGITELTMTDLLGCFQIPSTLTASMEAGFADCTVPTFLRELIMDEDESIGLSSVERLHLLEWCTALTALPCGGLKDPIVVRLFEGADDHDLPVVHTCTHELHLPAYTSRQTLQAKLMQAVEHRNDGFHIE